MWARSRSAPANRYLLDQKRARMTFTGTIQAMRDMHNKWPQTERTLVEDKANGSAVIDVLQREIAGVLPVTPQGGKVVRANAVTACVEAGNVFIPDDADWTGDFVEEFSAFPNGKNDDQVDAMSQANAYYNDQRTEFGFDFF
jgi:predicted phage terminase large subunit-like protein